MKVSPKMKIKSTLSRSGVLTAIWITTENSEDGLSILRLLPNWFEFSACYIFKTLKTYLRKYFVLDFSQRLLLTINTNIGVSQSKKIENVPTTIESINKSIFQ